MEDLFSKGSVVKLSARTERPATPMKSRIFLLVVLILQSGAAIAQMKADIVGLRLGMDLNETFAAIKAHAPTAQMTVLEERMPARHEGVVERKLTARIAPDGERALVELEIVL